MLQQVWVCLGAGLLGLGYMLIYERLAIMPGYRRLGEPWVAARALRWVRERDTPFGILWPGAEEAIVRGVPLLLFHNHWHLIVALAVTNVASVAAHPDRRRIGTKRCLFRYLRGILYSIPAIVFASLYGCVALHAAWNTLVAIRKWSITPGQTVLWTAGPLLVHQTNPVT